MNKRLVMLIIVILGLHLSVFAQAPAPILDADARYLEVNGASIYLIERGDPDGLPVILLHGFGGSVFTWRYTLDPLAEAGYRVIAFDRPPYGLSDKSPDFTWTPTAYADLTVGLMDALEIDAAILVGHSAGGAVIADVTALYPDRVLGLSIVAGAVLTGDPQADAWFTQQAEARGGDDESGMGGLAAGLRDINPRSPLAQLAVRALLTPERFADILISAYHDPSTVPADAIEGYASPLTVNGWEAAFLKILSGGMSSPVYTPDLWENITVPVLIQWGAEDTWVSPAVGLALAERLDGAELRLYPQTGHLPMEETIDTFNADLLAWLSAQF